jgi:hypothetical protein
MSKCFILNVLLLIFKLGYEHAEVRESSTVVLVLEQQHAMRMYGGVEVKLHTFLILILDGSDYPQAPPPLPTQVPFCRRSGGPNTWSGCSGREKCLCLFLKSNPGHPAHG